MTESTEAGAEPQRRAAPAWQKALLWGVTVACFAVLYRNLSGAAAREELDLVSYLGGIFSRVSWWQWLAYMVPYSFIYFLIDAAVVWRIINWFNAKVPYGDILPIRASAYIISILNEQVGKGAMTLYLLRHHKVPGWRALSSMILLGLMEIFQLLLFSAIGVALNFHLVVEASSQWPLDIILPAVMIFAFVYLPVHIAYFRTGEGGLREKPILTAFRQARPVHYFLIVVFKAPNLIGAVIVYTFALDLFQVEVSLGQMLAFLPVIFLAAALPLPFHAGALVLWTVLFPDYPEVAAFSLVMHTFFVVFNATIGVMFLPRANRELFG